MTQSFDNIDEVIADAPARTNGYRGVHAFNQSTAWAVVSKSPRHGFEAMHRKRYAADPDHSRDREIGNVTHALLLGATSGIVEVPAENYRTNAAQELRTAAETAGNVPILAPDMARCRRAAESLREQLEGFGLSLDGESEVAIYWKEGELACKSLLDHICDDGVTILDIKTGDSANPRHLMRRILDSGCHVQAAAYSRALAYDRPATAGLIRFIDVFIETSGLVLCTPVEIAGSLLELGERQWLRACRTWERCVAEGMYPGYTTGVIRPEAPAWALSNEESEQ